jgi:hypothetical protein
MRRTYAIQLGLVALFSVQYVTSSFQIGVHAWRSFHHRLDATSSQQLHYLNEHIRPNSPYCGGVLLSQPERQMILKSTTTSTQQLSSRKDTVAVDSESAAAVSTEFKRIAASIFLGSAILLSATFSIAAAPSVVWGYDETEYISDAVKVAIQAVTDATRTTSSSTTAAGTGSATNDALVKAYENIAEIITEGKGVGGAINFQGIQLDRGYVSDEDTSIYNPGLTLLTETEKNRLVRVIVESKQQQQQQLAATSNTAAASWNNDLEAGYTFLRERLDPLHMYELRGYLSVLPWYGAVMYLIAFAIQQLARDVFPIAYIVCAVAVFAPILVLVIIGP